MFPRVRCESLKRRVMNNALFQVIYRHDITDASSDPSGQEQFADTLHWLNDYPSGARTGIYNKAAQIQGIKDGATHEHLLVEYKYTIMSRS